MLKTLAVFPEDLGLIPKPHMAVHSPLKLQIQEV